MLMILSAFEYLKSSQAESQLSGTNTHNGKPLGLWVLRLDPLTIDALAHNYLGEIQGVSSIIFLPTTLYSTSNPI